MMALSMLGEKIDLVSWVMAKYRRFRNKKTRAGQYLARIAEARPELFVHWHKGIQGAFV